MKAFPFTRSEWKSVSDASFPILNATLSNDTAVRDSYFIELQEVLATLRVRYGDHPVLLETEADFSDDDSERLSLYQRAVALAEENQLPTLSIRLSLIRLLIDGGNHASALQELGACEVEVARADSDEASDWARLKAELSEA